MRKNFSTAYSLIRAAEGGFVHRSKKADPGGATNFGVTQDTYDAFRAAGNRPKQSVKLITEDEVRTIYWKQYANQVSFNQLPVAVDYMMFDFAIHSGAKRAKIELQEYLGVTQDGIIGVQTLGAVKKRMEEDPVKFINGFTEHRMNFLRGLRNWKANKNGWANRLQHMRRNALKMIDDQVIDVRDYADEYIGSAKGYGEQTLGRSISTSTRSKTAVAGSAGVVVAAVGEAVSMVEPVKEAFSWSKYVHIIGLVLAAAAFVYIIYHRSKSDGVNS